MLNIYMFIQVFVFYNAGRYMGKRDGQGFHENNWKAYFQDFCVTAFCGIVAIDALTFLASWAGM